MQWRNEFSKVIDHEIFKRKPHKDINVLQCIQRREIIPVSIDDIFQWLDVLQIESGVIIT